MTTGFKVFIFGSDVPFGKVLAKELERERIHAEFRPNEANISEVMRDSTPHLVIIDLNGPVSVYRESLRKIRIEHSDLPMVVLGTGNRAEYLEEAFEAGADDFLRRPVSLRELIARCRRLLMRSESTEVADTSCKLVLNRAGVSVMRSGRQIDLTPKEFAILEFLTQNSGKIVSRQTLMQEFWTPQGDTNVIDVYIKYLRDKIDKGHEHKLIRTVRGLGYVLKCGEYEYV